MPGIFNIGFVILLAKVAFCTLLLLGGGALLFLSRDKFDSALSTVLDTPDLDLGMGPFVVLKVVASLLILAGVGLSIVFFAL